MAPNTFLDRDTILAANDLPESTVEAPRWGGTVHIRALPIVSPAYTAYVYGGTQKDRAAPEEVTIRRHIGAVILGAAAEDGTRMFLWKDASALREKHWPTVLKVATAVYALSGDDDDRPLCPTCEGSGRLDDDTALTDAADASATEQADTDPPVEAGYEPAAEPI